MISKVLLLDGHTVQAISVARSLKERGYEVTAFIESKLSYGYVCRYIDHKIKSPKQSDAANFLPFIKEFLRRAPQDLIIPLYNDSAEFLSIHKQEIEKEFNTTCAVPEYATFIQAHDKEKLMELCREHGIPHPRTTFLSEENMAEAAKYVGFPSLIKPNISSGARGIMLVDNMEELKAKYPSIAENFGRCTLQEYIDHTGIYYNVMLYRDRNGDVHEPVVIKIMRYFPLKGGTSCYCETIRHDGLVKICQQTLDVLDWHGFADFDIMESKTGELKIIEINPRVPSSIHAAYISGINYPELMVKDAENQPMPHYRCSFGKALRFFGLDVMWFAFSPQRLNFKPSWFNLFGKNVYYQDGSLKDPLPMAMGVISGIMKYLNPAFRKSKLES